MYIMREKLKQIKLMRIRMLLSHKLMEMIYQYNKMMLFKEIQRHTSFRGKYLKGLHKMKEEMLRSKKMRY